MCAWICASGAFQAYPAISQSHREGLGFQNVRWSDSKLIRQLRELQPDRVIYSNSPSAVYFHAGRAAKRIPTSFHQVNQALNAQYDRELIALSRDLATGGLLVRFNLAVGSAALEEESLLRRLQLVPLSVYPDGTIYRH